MNRIGWEEDTEGGGGEKAAKTVEKYDIKFEQNYDVTQDDFERPLRIFLLCSII